ncbi:MAG: 2,3-bisphosphoglycerate-dependent phosphoglycerate mutase [Phormidesmis sp.]
MAKLILIRHGQSTWNAANKFTGWVDVPLSHQGRQEAIRAAYKLSPYRINACFTSLLIRAIETSVICLTEREDALEDKSPVLKHNADDPYWHGWDRYEGNHHEEIPVFLSQALDERYYGSLQGLNKAQTAESFGFELVHQWRRSFSARPPGGESLEDTAARTIPYFKNRILAHLKSGDNVLVSAHGNSLRSIVMFLHNLSQEEVCNLELATGVPMIYDISCEG